MTSKKSKKLPAKPAKKELIQHTFFLTEQQHSELKKIAEGLSCLDVPELFQKLIELGKIYQTCVEKGFDLYVVDPKEMKIVHSESDQRVLMLFDSKRSFADVSEPLAEALNINRAIKETNMFGLPVDAAGDA